MSAKEVPRAGLLKAVLAGRITNALGATALRMSVRQFQRVKNRLLRLSNARATATGAIPGADDGTPGRPTLKRRQPTPDDSTTTTPDGTQKPENTKPAPPTLRREPQAQPSPTPQP